MSSPYIESYHFKFHQGNDLHIVQTAQVERSPDSGQCWGNVDGGPVEYSTDPKEVLSKLAKRVINNEDELSKRADLELEIVGAGSVLDKDESAKVILEAGLSPKKWSYS